MRKLVLFAVLAAAVPAMAATAVFTKYESVRQALLKSSLAGVRTSAKALAAEARAARKTSVAAQADAVAAASTLDKARLAFWPLSDEMIRLRASSKGTRPSVYYCSMAKKSWLQPKGQVGNPYEPSMPMCGELREE